MTLTRRLLSLFAAGALLTTALHAQDTTAAPTQGRKMSAQVGSSLVIGPDPLMLGLDFRVFVPINSLRGLRLIPAIGITSIGGVNDNGMYVPFSLRLDIAYSFVRFGGRNGGLYGKMGPVYDIQLGLDEQGTRNAVGLDLGLGVQGNIGSFDIYCELGRVFSDFRRTEIVIGTTYGK